MKGLQKRILSKLYGLNIHQEVKEKTQSSRKEKASGKETKGSGNTTNPQTRGEKILIAGLMKTSKKINEPMIKGKVNGENLIRATSSVIIARSMDTLQMSIIQTMEEGIPEMTKQGWPRRMMILGKCY